MSPANDPPPASDGASRDVDTIDESTKEEPHADDRDRDRVHRGLEKLANVLRTSWEMTASAPGIFHGNYVTQEKRKEWLEDCNRYLRNGAIDKYLGGAYKLCLGEVDEEDLRPLCLSDDRRAYPMFLTAFIQKPARSEGGIEPSAMVTVNIVLPSTRLLPRDEWIISPNLQSLLDEESGSDKSDSSACSILLPKSVDFVSLVKELNDQVTSIMNTLEQQDMSDDDPIAQILSKSTLN